MNNAVEEAILAAINMFRRKYAYQAYFVKRQGLFDEEYALVRVDTEGEVRVAVPFNSLYHVLHHVRRHCDVLDVLENVVAVKCAAAILSLQNER